MPMILPASDSGVGAISIALSATITAGRVGGYGLMVEIDHGKGIVTRYGHLSRIKVKAGQRIEAGTIIGNVGSTGRSTGPHLHYETRVDDSATDPRRFLKAGRRLRTLL